MKSNKQAFTLIELLLVVLIIGILAAVALPQYQKAVDKSRFIQLQTLAQNIKNAQERYYLENGFYATRITDLDVEFAMPVSIQPCSAGIPASTYIYWNKIPGMLFISGYEHQCSTSAWNGRQACYAKSNEKRANQFCSNITGKPIQTTCGDDYYCKYWVN